MASTTEHGLPYRFPRRIKVQDLTPLQIGKKVSLVGITSQPGYLSDFGVLTNDRDEITWYILYIAGDDWLISPSAFLDILS